MAPLAVIVGNVFPAAFRESGSAVNGTIAGPLDGVSGLIGDLVTDVRDAATGAMENVQDFIVGIPHHVMQFLHNLPHLIISLIATLFLSGVHVLGEMMMQICSQIIGTGIIGVTLYAYRDQLKDIVANVVNTAGGMVPEDWVDEEMIIELVEDAVGIDTPDGSDAEDEVNKKSELSEKNESKPTEADPLLKPSPPRGTKKKVVRKIVRKKKKASNVRPSLA